MALVDGSAEQLTEKDLEAGSRDHCSSAITGSWKSSRQLGAGPLENLMPGKLLDDLRPWMSFSDAM
ncbi:hypothetical protein ASG42_21800 [Rhizobium sp. Leaf391]|nr:hypothetical protein [Rhizobium sp. Leaf391]KQT05154.1 hypothetical protein ASG42_21800 [Rhizobium sp. Leaf391]